MREREKERVRVSRRYNLGKMREITVRRMMMRMSRRMRRMRRRMRRMRRRMKMD